jgi:hypothetical protein
MMMTGSDGKRVLTSCSSSSPDWPGMRMSDISTCGGSTPVELRNGLARRGEALEGDALAGQGLFQHPADGAIVVDDPDGFHDFAQWLILSLYGNG